MRQKYQYNIILSLSKYIVVLNSGTMFVLEFGLHGAFYEKFKKKNHVFKFQEIQK